MECLRIPPIELAHWKELQLCPLVQFGGIQGYDVEWWQGGS